MAGDERSDDDAVPLDGESDSPVNMTTAATATITTRSAAAEPSRTFLRRPDEGPDDAGGPDGGGGPCSPGARYCVAAANAAGSGRCKRSVGSTGRAARVGSGCFTCPVGCAVHAGGAACV